VTFVPLVEPPEDAGPPARWYVVRQGEVLLNDPGHGWPDELDPELADVHDEEVFLGLEDGQPWWAAGVPAGTPAPLGTRWAALMPLNVVLGADSFAVAGRAVQLVEWRRTSRHCGRCGASTESVKGERAMRCPSCGLMAFPRLAPAVIVAVQREDRILLARNARFPGRMFSVLAGFVEPGETLEQAVHREVGEEVGVTLRNVRYFGSQPWPFPHSLMVGFRAEWAGGEIAVDGVEIAEAAWFSLEELPRWPPSISIARQLVDAWRAEAEEAADKDSWS
jgi:NAD+ diphosphatase